MAADQLDEVVGLGLAAAALFDELLDTRFDNRATLRSIGRNDLALIDATKHRFTLF
jgi:hypothetical protein